MKKLRIFACLLFQACAVVTVFAQGLTDWQPAEFTGAGGAHSLAQAAEPARTDLPPIPPNAGQETPTTNPPLLPTDSRSTQEEQELTQDELSTPEQDEQDISIDLMQILDAVPGEFMLEFQSGLSDQPIVDDAEDASEPGAGDPDSLVFPSIQEALDSGDAMQPAEETEVVGSAHIVVVPSVHKITSLPDPNTGEITEVSLDSGRLLVGDEILFTMRCRNEGDGIAERVVVTYPIPEVVVYLPYTTTGENTSLFYSVDGGYSFSTWEFLQNQNSNKAKPSASMNVTHVRWIYESLFIPGQTSVLTFRAQLL